ncbi:hypothetical protein LEMLEM_LOCUS4709 [Lemmus lemmus]
MISSVWGKSAAGSLHWQLAHQNSLRTPRERSSEVKPGPSSHLLLCSGQPMQTTLTPADSKQFWKEQSSDTLERTGHWNFAAMYTPGVHNSARVTEPGLGREQRNARNLSSC